jgi:hypothetical protein
VSKVYTLEDDIVDVETYRYSNINLKLHKDFVVIDRIMIINNAMNYIKLKI